ncbi:lipopolysaccharide heptosyltransferase II, partial [Candidatus Poribacteria bacterium]
MIGFSRIGDTVLSTCVIDPLLRAFPGCSIRFLLSPLSAEVLRGDPRVEEVLIYDRSGRHSGLRGR